jgi:hypothetical protein
MRTHPAPPNITLSMIWVFIVVNFFARDFHELGRAGVLEQMMSCAFNGVEITEELMLIGGVMIEIPILMILLSLLLRREINRWVNFGGAVLTAAIIVMNNLDPDLDNIFFMIIQLVALVAIVGVAGRWQPEKTW